MLKRRVVLVGMHERECNRLVRTYAGHCLLLLTWTQGTADSIVVKNGVTRIIYPTGACYEGEVRAVLHSHLKVAAAIGMNTGFRQSLQVRNGKRHGNGLFTWMNRESVG